MKLAEMSPLYEDSARRIQRRMEELRRSKAGCIMASITPVIVMCGHLRQLAALPQS